MDSARYVAVGGRVVDPEVPALLGLATRYGVPIRAAALRPPVGRAPASGGLPPTDRPRTTSGGQPGPNEVLVVPWHQLRTPLSTTTVLGGLVQQLTRRVLRGPAAELEDALGADPWLAAELEDASTGSVLLVALDDAAAQALARWRSRKGVEAPLLTWSQAAERLAEEVARAVPSTPAQTSPRRARPMVNPGAMHRVTVATAPRAEPRDDLLAVLPRMRSKVLHVRPGEDVPAGTDVLVLDGLGPAVAVLPDLPREVRVVHLPRPQDRSSPWRHLVDVDRVVHGGAGPWGASIGEEDLAGLLLGAETAELVRLTRDGEDEAALARAEDLLASGPTDPLLLREITYLARVTGSLTLEGRVLRTTAERRTLPEEHLDRALARVTDRLRETDPAWFPQLPATEVDPVPGRVLHLLKTTLPQRQAGYSVRGHHSLRALVSAGSDVVAVAVPERLADDADPQSPADGPQTSPSAAQEVVLDGVRYLVPPPVQAPGGTAYLEAAARVVRDLVVAERPAVLHVHSGHRGYDLGVVGAAVAEATGLPWVYEVRGLFESTWTQDQRRAERGETFERRMAREADLARRADATVTLAETMRDDLVARGVPAARVHVVPNAVDPERLRPVERDQALVRRYDAAGRFTFGYVSNLDHAREQVEDLVRAAILLQSRGRPTLCLVVGTGTREQELRSLTDRLGAGGYVTFTGRVPHDEVTAYYALLDVLVVPRSDERAARLVTPLKPFEAMAAGLPVVVSAQPALLEVIADGRGWSYPAGDAAALADLLEHLADTPQERETVASRARAWVTQERTWARNAGAYQDLYEELTGSADAGGSR